MENAQFQELVLQQLKTLTEGQTRLEQGFAKLEQRQAKLEDRLERIEKKLDAVSEQTAMLIEFRIEVNEKLDALEAAQNRQEIILERLAFRSIEHEANIAHLQRAK